MRILAAELRYKEFNVTASRPKHFTPNGVSIQAALVTITMQPLRGCWHRLSLGHPGDQTASWKPLRSEIQSGQITTRDDSRGDQ